MIIYFKTKRVAKKKKIKKRNISINTWFYLLGNIYTTVCSHRAQDSKLQLFIYIFVQTAK